MRKVFESNGATFSALNAAQQWCKENGYSHGVLCGDLPIGIKKGDYAISKWRNLTAQEQTQLMDGKMTSGDYREGSVTVEIRE